MVMEIAAHLVVRVANAPGVDAAGGEKQARSLYRASGEDEVIGFEAEGSAGVVADQGGFDAGSIRGEEKFCEVCMEIKRGGASLLQLFANRGCYIAAGERGAFGEAGAEFGQIVE